MASIKKLMDPNGILNPYKVLPHSIVSYSWDKVCLFIYLFFSHSELSHLCLKFYYWKGLANLLLKFLWTKAAEIWNDGPFLHFFNDNYRPSKRNLQNSPNKKFHLLWSPFNPKSKLYVYTGRGNHFVHFYTASFLFSNFYYYLWC